MRIAIAWIVMLCCTFAYATVDPPIADDSFQFVSVDQCGVPADIDSEMESAKSEMEVALFHRDIELSEPTTSLVSRKHRNETMTEIAFKKPEVGWSI